MGKLNFVISLTTEDNDYQQEQAKAAVEAANQLGVSIEIVYAEGDAINQSQQLLKLIQSSGAKPDGVVFEPCGTALAQVAQAAAMAGIGWCVLNSDVDYISSLRMKYRSPMFVVSSDHVEVGRIQGRQMGVLMPRGGTALYIEGPGSATAAPLRTKGMQETKPSNIQVRAMKGKWTEESGYNAIASWLRLTTSRDVQIGAVIAQNDAMAAGARRAFQELTKGTESDKWLSVPFTGVDGLKKTGAAWVDSGMLAATIVMPANAGTGLEMMVKAVESGQQPPEQSFTQPRSYPALERITVPKSSTVRL